MIILDNDSLLRSLESNQFIICLVSLSMVLCFFNVNDKAYSLLIADQKSMASLTGVLLDVSCSMVVALERVLMKKEDHGLVRSLKLLTTLSNTIFLLITMYLQ